VTKNPGLAQLQVQEQNRYWIIAGLGHWMTTAWFAYVGTLHDSKLEVEIWDGVPDVVRRFATLRKVSRLGTWRWDYQLLGEGRHGYVARDAEHREFSAEDMADHILKMYMDAAARFKPPAEF
jgi:hypothetical protein